MATVDDGRHLHTCPLCEAMCGLEIRVADGPSGGRVVGIRGNRDDVWSRGHICPKARRWAPCMTIRTASGTR